MPSRPRFLDLFAGAGGMGAGFARAGWRPVAAYDDWPDALATHAANHAHPAIRLDLACPHSTRTELDQWVGTGGGFPTVIGGPPCQDFSSAGRLREGGRADLTERFASIVAHYRPPVAVMENVARAERAAVFASAIGILDDAGFETAWTVVDAARYGVPQTRKRLITIAARTPGAARAAVDALRARAADRDTTMRDWFGDRLGTDHFYRHPTSYARRGVFSIDAPSPTIRGMNRPIPPGYRPHPGDTAPPEQARPLTAGERAEVQTFPPDYAWVGSRGSVEQQIGNAVPPLLAEHIAIAARTALPPDPAGSRGEAGG